MTERKNRFFAVSAVVAGLALAACGDQAATTPSGSAAGSTKPASSTKPTTSTKPATSASAAPSASAASEPGPDFKFAAMKITIDKHTIELKDDGTVLADGKEAAKFVKNELKSTDGKHTVSVAKDGLITWDGKNEKGLKFDEKDNVATGDKKGSISVGDDGKVTMTKQDGTPEKDQVAFTGFKPEARRAAGIILLMFLMSSEGASSTPSASAAPAASAAPK